MSQRVRHYFDELANEYSGFYLDINGLHARRLSLALQERDLQDKSILDVGAGSGSLYDELSRRGHTGEYMALDLSRKMLDQSRIPPDQTWIGDFPDFDSGVSYDLVFALGLYNYLDERQRMIFWKWLDNILAPGGLAVVSFTNALNPFNRWRNAVKSVLYGRRFPDIHMSKPDEIVCHPLNTGRIQFFNSSIPWKKSHTTNTQSAWSYTDFLIEFRRSID